ncbi:DnaJ-domain-containing protein [Acaromyces ingoldii]|uniref:DnaJ-domain-containing protein n=1 Tax=Acaromyces ingoldii TaxID=215250 RepID=A0A316YQ91_9BASI|nr:DnaJ-domain-containing protein [Acaromyces ingoldii]PWN91459.1 DnaJ-domain-containing protein [Acaromyces ingoldii]
MSSPEDAQKAYNLAMKHSSSGNLEGALKWARKAMSMDPNSSQAKILLTSLEKGHMPGNTSTQNQANGSSAEAGTSSSSSGKSSAMPNGTASAAHRRPAAAGASSAAEEKRPQREYTKEQAKIVTQVNKAGRDNDFYGVLGLKKEDKPDENAIKKGYRKLALQLHPDKNGAPGADEAFKIVSKAFTILSDSNKKAIYDQTGSDPDSRGGGGGGSGFSQFARGGPGGATYRTYGGGGMNGEIDPQDLFNMFFGGGGTTFHFGGPGVHFGPGMPRRPRAGGHQPQQESTSILLQLLPILILGLFSLLSYAPTLFGTPDPLYTWNAQGAYRMPRTTLKHNVKYHVDPTAWSQHPFVQAAAGSGSATRKDTSKLDGFERRVENSYKNILYNECERRRDYQERRLRASMGTLFGIGADREAEKRIREEVYESCERLRDFGLYMPLRI